jgi:hypothetical protein
MLLSPHCTSTVLLLESKNACTCCTYACRPHTAHTGSKPKRSAQSTGRTKALQCPIATSAMHGTSPPEDAILNPGLLDQPLLDAMASQYGRQAACTVNAKTSSMQNEVRSSLVTYHSDQTEHLHLPALTGAQTSPSSSYCSAGSIPYHVMNALHAAEDACRKPFKHHLMTWCIYRIMISYKSKMRMYGVIQ